MSDLYFKGLGYYVTPRSRSRPCASFLKRSRDWLGFLQHHETSDCFSFCICYITIWLFCSYPRAAISGLNMDSLSVWQPREPSSINSKKCNRSLSGFGERKKKLNILFISSLFVSKLDWPSFFLQSDIQLVANFQAFMTTTFFLDCHAWRYSREVARYKNTKTTVVLNLNVVLDHLNL